jgi:hypothetical protein
MTNININNAPNLTVLIFVVAGTDMIIAVKVQDLKGCRFDCRYIFHAGLKQNKSYSAK